MTELQTTENLLLMLVGLLCIILLLLLALLRKLDQQMKLAQSDAFTLLSRFDQSDKAQERTERAMREEIATNREEYGAAAREQRREQSEALKQFGDSMAVRIMDIASLQKMQLDTFSNQLDAFVKGNSAEMLAVRTEAAAAAKQLREEVLTLLNGILATTTKTLGELAGQQQLQLEAMTAMIGKLSETNEKKLAELRLTVEGKLQSLQADNAKQLEQMRQTVDEKLQGTLEKRLGESFKQVSDRLEMVHKGLGEMQTLATGVGDLKRVLTNVKSRGTWGEVQLGTLLEQILTPEQYAANVSPKNNGDKVEFAIRLPGQGADRDETVWLPIDAKFPVEDYLRLLDAQEKIDVDAAAAAGRDLERSIKVCAAAISAKYICPPKTTDFAIMFLPTEGLFAEVIRRTGLMETIQRDQRVVIAGPTTLWSIVNSLQMGFRTLAIQKRSSEVWNLLAAVKGEWSKYGEMLDTVQKKLHQATESIEKAKVRTRAVGRKLRDVQALPPEDAAALLPFAGMEEDAAAGEEDADTTAAGERSGNRYIEE